MAESPHQAATSLDELIAGMGDAVLVVDHEGVIVVANERVESLLGWSPADLAGRPLRDLVPEHLRAAHDAGFSRFRARGEIERSGIPLHVSALTPEGREVEVELVLGRVTLGEEVLAVGSLRPVAGHQYLEPARATIDEISRLLTTDRPFDEIVEGMLRILGERYAWDAAVLWSLDPRTQRLTAIGTWTGDATSTRFADGCRQLAMPRDEGLLGVAWTEAQPAWSTDVSDDPRYLRRQIEGDIELRAAYLFPVATDRRVVGVVELRSRRARQYDRGIEHSLQRIGNELAGLLLRRLVEETLRIERARLELALRAGRMGIWDWDARTNAVTWSDTLEGIFGVEPGCFGGTFEDFVDLVHPDDRDGVLSAIAETSKDPSGQDLHVVHRVKRPDRRTVWVEGFGHSVIDVETGEFLGMVGVAADVSARREADAERERLLDLERSVRVDLERIHERDRLLATVGQAVNATLDEREATRNLLAVLVPAIADFGILVARPRTSATGMNTVAVRHRRPEHEEVLSWFAARYPWANDGGISEAVEAGHTLRLTREPHAAYAETGRALLDRFSATSIVAAPIGVQGRVVGALVLGTVAERELELDLEALASDIAQRAGLALEAARVFEQERSVADAFQQTLYPEALPSAPGLALGASYRTAEAQVGGDFYDAFSLLDRRLAVVVGDVRGRGPAAAASTNRVRFALRTAATVRSDPAEITSIVNRMFHRDTDPEVFCSFVLVALRPGRTGLDAEVVRAGHPFPLLLTNDQVRPVTPDGMLAGLVDDAVFEVGSVHLDPGDRLLLYTDGVVEAVGDADRVARSVGVRERFGEARLVELLRARGTEPVERLCRHVLDEVEAFAGRFDDDAAVMAIGAVG